MTMSAEVKDRLREYGRAKRKRTVLLKDVDPMALMIFARDEYDDKIGEDRGPWAYLSRASVAQIDALRSLLEHHEVTVGSRVGPRRVYVFRSRRLRFALERLGMTPSKTWSYVKELHPNWRPPVAQGA